MNQTTDETQTLEETLNKTDFGHMINENKKPILIGAFIVVALILGFSIYKSQSESKLNEALSDAYTFRVDVLDAYSADKVKKEIVLEKLISLPTNLVGQASLVPALLKAVDKLAQDGLVKESVAVLENWQSKFNKNEYMFYFVGLKLAAFYENASENTKAITLLEQLLASKKDSAKAKIYLDLGRLYLLTDNKEKAKSNLNFVINNHKDSEYAKIAKLYIGQAE